MGIDAFNFKNHQFPEEDRDKRRKEVQNIQKSISKMAMVNAYLSLISLNVNWLILPTNGQTAHKQIFLKTAQRNLVLRTHTELVERMKKNILTDEKPNRAGMVIYKRKSILQVTNCKKRQEGHHTMIKWPINTSNGHNKCIYIFTQQVNR